VSIYSPEIFAVNASSLVVVGASLSLRTNATQLFAKLPSFTEALDIAVWYTQEGSSALDPLAGLPSIEISSFDFPKRGVWTVVFAALDGEWSKAFSVNLSVFRHLFVTVSPQNSFVGFAASSAGSGFLVTPDGAHVFDVGTSRLVLEDIEVSFYRNKPSPWMIIVAAVVGGVLVIVIFILAVVLICQRRHRQELMNTQSLMSYEAKAHPIT
jgi:hypothetical protein